MASLTHYRIEFRKEKKRKEFGNYSARAEVDPVGNSFANWANVFYWISLFSPAGNSKKQLRATFYGVILGSAVDWEIDRTEHILNEFSFLPDQFKIQD